MSAKTFISIAGVLFGLVALLHAVRLAMGWQMVIGGWNFPVWLSAIGVVIPGYLAYSAFRLNK
jgi:hypothetical protein